MQSIASAGISMATDYQNGLIEFIQHTRHGVEHRVKLGANLMTAGSEGNIAGHDQPKRIALTTNLYPSALQLFAQLGLLRSEERRVGKELRAEVEAVQGK